MPEAIRNSNLFFPIHLQMVFSEMEKPNDVVMALNIIKADEVLTNTFNSEFSSIALQTSSNPLVILALYSNAEFFKNLYIQDETTFESRLIRTILKDNLDRFIQTTKKFPSDAQINIILSLFGEYPALGDVSFVDSNKYPILTLEQAEALLKDFPPKDLQSLFHRIMIEESQKPREEILPSKKVLLKILIKKINQKQFDQIFDKMETNENKLTLFNFIEHLLVAEFDIDLFEKFVAYGISHNLLTTKQYENLAKAFSEKLNSIWNSIQPPNEKIDKKSKKKYIEYLKTLRGLITDDLVREENTNHARLKFRTNLLLSYLEDQALIQIPLREFKQFSSDEFVEAFFDGVDLPLLFKKTKKADRTKFLLRCHMVVSEFGLKTNSTFVSLAIDKFFKEIKENRKTEKQDKSLVLASLLVREESKAQAKEFLEQIDFDEIMEIKRDIANQELELFPVQFTQLIPILMSSTDEKVWDQAEKARNAQIAKTPNKEEIKALANQSLIHLSLVMSHRSFQDSFFKAIEQTPDVRKTESEFRFLFAKKIKDGLEEKLQDVANTDWLKKKPELLTNISKQLQLINPNQENLLPSIRKNLLPNIYKSIRESSLGQTYQKTLKRILSEELTSIFEKQGDIRTEAEHNVKLRGQISVLNSSVYY